MMAVVISLIELRVYSAHGLYELYWLEGLTFEVQVGEESLTCFGHDRSLIEGSLLAWSGSVVLECVLQLIDTL